MIPTKELRGIKMSFDYIERIKQIKNEKKITNDMGGPNFIPYTCVYPNLLIGIVSAADCSDEFLQKHRLTTDDNPILVILKLK